MDTYLAPALGALILLGITVVIRQLGRLSETLTKQGETVVALHTVLLGANGAPGLVQRVQSLHDWREEMHAREIDDARAEVVELKRRRGDKT